MPQLDLEALGQEMNIQFAGIQVIGCTTAGEIGPAGYLEHSISGASFPASHFTAVCDCLENLAQFTIANGQNFAKALMKRLEGLTPQALPENSFAFLMTDGLSVREEQVTRALQSTLGQLPLIGGSAGDGFDFEQTHVFFDGRFRTDCAVLALLTTSLPFQLFETHHFVATEERLVVTQADPSQRTVKEINGLPAAWEYARVLGIQVRDLNPEIYSARPVVVLINGESYVRSIQKATPDGGLKFYCAIENGLILRVAKGVKLLANLEQTFADIHRDIGHPQLILGCDCLLRRVEVFQSPDKEQVISLLLRNNTTGFGTYGEQFRGTHLNQTLTGVAIAYEPGRGG